MQQKSQAVRSATCRLQQKHTTSNITSRKQFVGRIVYFHTTPCTAWCHEIVTQYVRPKSPDSVSDGLKRATKYEIFSLLLEPGRHNSTVVSHSSLHCHFPSITMLTISFLTAAWNSTFHSLKCNVFK